MLSWTSTWAAISWMWCGTDGECPAQRRKGLFVQSLPCLCAHPPSLLPSHLFNKYLLTTIERWDSQVMLVVKNPPADAGDMRLWVWSLGWEDPLEKGMATHSSILAWRIPWTVRCRGLQSMGSHRVRQAWAWSTIAPQSVSASESPGECGKTRNTNPHHKDWSSGSGVENCISTRVLNELVLLGFRLIFLVATL